MTTSAIMPITRAADRPDPPLPYWWWTGPGVTKQTPKATVDRAAADRVVVKVPSDTTRGTKLDIFV